MAISVSVRQSAWALLLSVSALFWPSLAASGREKAAPAVASVEIQIGMANCKVDLDDATEGKTGPTGNLVLAAVPPGDHYIHVDCPGQQEKAFFVSLGAGQHAVIKPEMAISGDEAPAASPLEEAQNRIKLSRAVQQAVRLRARGDFESAVKLLHEATRLDPENSDLHRELGITFLLDKDWARARVEMLEAIRHNPQDADAHNGLGYALDKMGNLDGALKEFRTATHLEPDDASYQQHYLEALGKIAEREELKKEKRK
jgi:tetratricopeptide (TPR) repeat protein